MVWENVIEISSPEQVVWDLTIDVAAWSDFMPTMQWLRPLQSGPLVVGSRVRVKQPLQMPLIWTVIQVQAPSLFVWQSKVGWWVLTATHGVVGQASGCRNHLQFELSGPLSSWIGVLVSPFIKWALSTENRCFRKRAEDWSREVRS